MRKADSQSKLKLPKSIVTVCVEAAGVEASDGSAAAAFCKAKESRESSLICFDEFPVFQSHWLSL